MRQRDVKRGAHTVHIAIIVPSAKRNNEMATSWRCLFLTIVGGATVSIASGLSVSRREENYILRPWFAPNDDVVVGQVRVDYRYTETEESTSHLTVSTKVIDSGLSKESTTTVCVPIPDQEGNLASSLWPASCAAAVWWCKYGSDLWMMTTENSDGGSSDDNEHAIDPSSSFGILELGSGLGVTGWITAAVVASRHAANIQLWLTDQDDEALRRLSISPQYNKNQNYRSRIHVTSKYLDWRDEHTSTDLSREKVDVVVGSDVAYYHHLLGPIADTLHTYASKNDALVVLISPASRQSIWDLYHLIRDGGYNQKTDVYGDPWPGTVRMLLYRLQEQAEEECIATPIVILCWTSNTVIDQRLQWLIRKENICVATDKDEALIDKYF